MTDKDSLVTVDSTADEKAKSDLLHGESLDQATVEDPGFPNQEPVVDGVIPMDETPQDGNLFEGDDSDFEMSDTFDPSDATFTGEEN